MNSVYLECLEYVDRVNIVKERIKYYFEFELPFGVIMCIADNERYNTLCAMLGMLKINNKISKKEFKIIKERIKNIFNIEHDYQRLNSTLILMKE